jgi:hypothetical protein
VKVALRQDLLERRRQHEAINLRMDDVRIKHEKAANIAQVRKLQIQPNGSAFNRPIYRKKMS